MKIGKTAKIEKQQKTSQFQEDREKTCFC